MVFIYQIIFNIILYITMQGNDAFRLYKLEDYILQF